MNRKIHQKVDRMSFYHIWSFNTIFSFFLDLGLKRHVELKGNFDYVTYFLYIYNELVFNIFTLILVQKFEFMIYLSKGI